LRASLAQGGAPQAQADDNASDRRVDAAADTEDTSQDENNRIVRQMMAELDSADFHTFETWRGLTHKATIKQHEGQLYFVRPSFDRLRDWMEARGSVEKDYSLVYKAQEGRSTVLVSYDPQQDAFRRRGHNGMAIVLPPGQKLGEYCQRYLGDKAAFNALREHLERAHFDGRIIMHKSLSRDDRSQVSNNAGHLGIEGKQPKWLADIQHDQAETAGPDSAARRRTAP